MLRPLCIAIAFLASGCGDSTPDFTPPTPPDHNAIAALVDAATLDELAQATVAVGASPRSADAWRTLATVYEVADINREAEDCYAAAAGLDPSEPRHPYRAAICAAREGELERSLSYIETVLNLDDEYGPAWRRQGTWLLELGRSAEARASFDEARSLLPGLPDALIGLAQVALLEDRLEEALSFAESAHASAKSDPYPRLILGDALRRAGRMDEAQAHLAAGEGTKPSYVDPWSESVARARRRDQDAMDRATTLEREGKWTAALSIYEDLEVRRPEDSAVLLRKGRALMGAKRTAEALTELERATRKFPGDYDLGVARVDALRRSSALNEALTALGPLINRWPDRVEGYLVRARILDEMGNMDAARGAYRDAAARTKNDLRPQLFEGQMLSRRGRHAQAVEVLLPAALEETQRPSLSYFQMTLQAMIAARSSTGRVQLVYERAVAVHGEEAEKRFSKSRGAGSR